MEIINPNSLPGDNARGCTTDALAPEHSCLDGGGCGCYTHGAGGNDNGTCFTCRKVGD